MKKLNIFASLCAALCVMSAAAQPATPQLGFRWVVNESVSDEFNAKEFDSDKWHNADPNSWLGRSPGLFEAEAMSVGDGKLRLTVDELKKPVMMGNQKFTHRGAHVYSKSLVLPGSYVECSMKANKTFMSSTFWLITSGPREGCDGRTTELDIQECIGFPEDNRTMYKMGSNTHSRQLPKGCDFPTGSVGNNAETKTKVTEDYHTYAVWWKRPTELLFYLDGEYKFTITPAAPFDLPMAVKMVCETYNWSKAPEDGGMTGSFEDRTTSYDWVRCYRLVPVTAQVSKSESKANAIFGEDLELTGVYQRKGVVEVGVVYSSPKDTKMSIQLIAESGRVVAKSTETIYSGAGNMRVALPTKGVKDGSYKVVVTMGEQGETTNVVLR